MRWELATWWRSADSASFQVGIGITDDSGLVTIFLNPDATYNYIFSKTGFSNNVFSLNPASSDIFTVIMGGGQAGIIDKKTEVYSSTTYFITPTNASLSNNTDILFGFQVNSSQTITLISMNITGLNQTTGGNEQLTFQSNAGTGFISDTVNTQNFTRIFGYYSIQTADETITVTRDWVVGEFFEGDYSLFKQMKEFIGYDFSDFIRIILVLGSIFGLLLFLSGTEIIERPESQIMVVIMMIWACRLVGWLDTGLILISDNINITRLSQFGSQFGIAIVASCIAAWSIFRRVRVI